MNQKSRKNNQRTGEQMKTSSSGKRLPKLERVSKKDRPALRVLSDPMIQTLFSLYEMRVLTASQIQQLHYSPTLRTLCAAHLQKLFHNEYVRRSEQKQYRTEPPKPLLYWLDIEG